MSDMFFFIEPFLMLSSLLQANAQIYQENRGKLKLLRLLHSSTRFQTAYIIMLFAGTASVIIALTDGELNEWQFDTAQREVMSHTHCTRAACHDCKPKRPLLLVVHLFALKMCDLNPAGHFIYLSFS